MQNKDKDNTKIQTRRKTEIQNTQSHEDPNSRFPPQNQDDDDFQSKLFSNFSWLPELKN